MTNSKDSSKEEKKPMLEKLYSDKNVFQAAMERIDIIHSMFDHIFISFSGGKDSLVCLKLFELYRKANGINEKLNVVFYDEEIVNTEVIKFVEKIRESGRYNFHWICTPLESEKFILGEKERYIQWDPNREHIRPIPEYAETGDGKIRYQSEVSEIYTKGLNGKICVVLGLRADESINRLRAVFKTGGRYPFMNKGNGKIMEAKPIYDWSEKDIFKFLYDFNIEYCDVYDYEAFNGDNLRVSTPLHAEAAKTALVKMKTMDPILYDQIMNIFPEIEIQNRYYKSLSKKNTSDFEGYEHTWEGVLKFARDVTSGDVQADLVKKIKGCKRYREKMEKSNEENKLNYGGYPLKYVFKTIATGGYKRYIPPYLGPVTDALTEFEKQ